MTEPAAQEQRVNTNTSFNKMDRSFMNGGLNTSKSKIVRAFGGGKFKLFGVPDKSPLSRASVCCGMNMSSVTYQQALMNGGIGITPARTGG